LEEAVEALEDAIKQVAELGETTPGDYVVFSQTTSNKIPIRISNSK
jgi:hypothetical protein